MLKKFKKLGLALLLPATAMVIATPLVLTSCNASESLVIESEKQNNENLVVDKTTSDQTKTETQEKEKIVKTLESKVFSKKVLLEDYFFGELIRKFLSFPIENQTDKTVPASKEFKTELLSSGLLGSAIKVYNLDLNITNMEIKKDSTNNKESNFTVVAPDATKFKYGALQIPITITTNTNKTKQVGDVTSNIKTYETNLTIEPKITTFYEIIIMNVGLDNLYNSIYDTSNSTTNNNYSHIKENVKKLHDEFQTNIKDKESVLEQAISYNLANKGGLVSYNVTFKDTKLNNTPIAANDNALEPIDFIPFKIKGNYTYYLDNYVPQTTKPKAGKPGTSARISHTKKNDKLSKFNSIENFLTNKN